MSPQENLHSLQTVVEQIKRRLKKAGHGAYQTVEAADILLTRLITTNTLDEMGAEVMRLGCRVAIVEGSGRGLSSGMLNFSKRTRELMYQRQQAVFSGPDGSWLDDEVALGEGPNATRMSRRDCRFEEQKLWIALKRKKAAETAADADRGQRIIDMNPWWEQRPHLTLEQVISATNDNKRAS